MGQFGSVSKATWNNQQGGFKKVAVKTLKPSMKKDTRIVFLKEAAIMGQFSHSNVVQLYGVVTVGEPVSPLYMLMTKGYCKILPIDHDCYGAHGFGRSGYISVQQL